MWNLKKCGTWVICRMWQHWEPFQCHCLHNTILQHLHTCASVHTAVWNSCGTHHEQSFAVWSLKPHELPLCCWNDNPSSGHIAAEGGKDHHVAKQGDCSGWWSTGVLWLVTHCFYTAVTSLPEHPAFAPTFYDSSGKLPPIDLWALPHTLHCWL
jgi:hypothetical protein